MAKQYIHLYFSYLDAIEPLSDAERGRLFTVLLEYGKLGATQELGGNERFIYPMMKAQIDRDNEAYDDKCRNNSESGKLGGRPKKTDGFVEIERLSENQTLFQKAKKAKEKEKEKEKEKDNVNIVVVKSKSAEKTEPEQRQQNFKTIQAHYEKHLGNLLSNSAFIKIQEFLESGVEESLICAAIDKSIDNGARNWAYASAILDSCVVKGILTVEQYKLSEANWNASKDKKINQNGASSKTQVRKTKFSNFKERDIDFTEIKQLEAERIDREMEGFE